MIGHKDYEIISPEDHRLCSFEQSKHFVELLKLEKTELELQIES